MEGTGTLTVRVITSRAQLPVEGATVVVTQRGTGGKYQLLSVQATDRSGATKPVAISTPALGESTHPGSSVPPYAVCDVWAEHPGYAMLLVEDKVVDGWDDPRIASIFHLVLHQRLDITFCRHHIGQIHFCELNLARRIFISDFSHHPVVQRTVILKLHTSASSRESFASTQ